MKNVEVVIGLNYGDEGKGLVTDYLSKQYADEHAVVFRFNGGGQAAHTVVQPDGYRHVFHHVGSGTFAGLPTALTRHFVVSPALLLEEAGVLLDEFGIDVFELGVAIDPNARVTTPYDIFVNQELERARGKDRHGSCGIGFNETLQRDESGTIFISDLFDIETLTEKLCYISEEYFPERLEELGLEPESMEFLHGAFDAFVEHCTQLADLIHLMDDVAVFDNFDCFIFEGAQGLCLDKNSRDFPHVTNSNTGMKNVAEIIEEYGEEDVSLNINYVTRSYLTRHGAGPLYGELEDATAEDPTNVPNEFQEELRFAPLDVDRIAEEVSVDIKHYGHFTDVSVTAIITCCDQNDLINNRSVEEIVELVTKAVGADETLTSWGPTSGNVLPASESLGDRLPA